MIKVFDVTPKMLNSSLKESSTYPRIGFSSQHGGRIPENRIGMLRLSF